MDVGQGFHVDSALAEHHHRPELRITEGADHGLYAARHHGRQEHARCRCAGRARARHEPGERVGGGLRRDVENDAASLALVEQLGGDDLHRETRRQTCGRADGVVGGSGDVERRHGNPVGRQQLPRLRLEFLRDRLGMRLGAIHQAIEARLPDVETAGLLDTDLTEPVLALRLIVTDFAGNPVEVSDAFYRADRYRYEGETRLPPARQRLNVRDARPRQGARTVL